jgi:TonB-linked SusC/RagA family outer membrane protein
MKNNHFKLKTVMDGKTIGLWLLMMIFGYGISTAQVAATVPQTSNGQQRLVSVNFYHKPLPNALKAIAQKANAGISFKTVDVPNDLITYEAEDESVYHVLDDVLEGTDLYYTLSDNKRVILIKQKLSKMVVQQETVSGTVTDAQTGDPLAGVNILEVGTSNGTATNSKGHYSLQVKSLQDSLRFSYIGYQTQKVPMNGRTSIDVELKTATQGLNQLVVIGFGSQSRRKIVGSVTTVDSSAFSDVSSTTIDKALQGRVAGVDVTSMSGVIGSPVSIHIRGTSSINANSQPLYVIDGMPIMSSTFGSTSTNPLVNIDPDNIKSMEVLKDATATAIYGTRGANGVILITTKNGVAGKPQLNIKVSGGIMNPTKKYHPMETPGFLKIYNYKNGTNLDPDDFSNTYWLGTITRTGVTHNYYASLSGGSKDNQYFVSGYYKTSKGFMKKNGAEKMGLRLTGGHQFNKKINVKYSINPSYSDLSQLAGRGGIANAYTMALLTPPTVAVRSKTGELNNGVTTSIQGNDLFSSFPGTPYGGTVGRDEHNRVIQVLGNVSASYDILSNLTLKTKIGIQYLGAQINSHANNFAFSGYPNGSTSGRSFTRKNYNWQNTLMYKNDWGKGQSIQVTLGTTFNSSERNYISVSASKLPSNDFSAINTASEVSGFGGVSSAYRFQNNLMRVTYTLKDRYTITGTGSYDGTSRFASENRYGFFPSIGAGWIISDENFMKDLSALSLLKLRVSYGITGNARIGNFDYAGLIGAGYNYHDEPGFAVSQIENPNLGWEKSKQFSVSLDYNFFNGRLDGTLSYYRKKESDLILSNPVSNINGFTSIDKNLGSLMNKGVEFSIKAKILTRKFSWSIFANIATNNNKITDLPGGTIVSGNSIVKVGKPLGTFYLPVYKGVDKSNGDALYSDGKGGVTNLYGSAPRQMITSALPDFSGGFGTNLSYKGLDVSVNFQYSYGAKLYWELGRYMACNNCVVYNEFKSQLDFWTPNNVNATVPEPRLSPNGSNPSTRWLSDASFLRLKAINLGYTLPPFSTSSSIRLFVQATNLFTVTDYIGADPEGNSNYGSNIQKGFIYFNVPQSKAWKFGIDFKF